MAHFERIRAEQTLQQREDFNRTILATAMDGFFVLDFAADPGGAIVAVNDAFCRLIGYNREELHQMRMTDLEAEETPEDVAQHKARIMAAGADRFETRHRRKDGLEIQVEISVSKLAISSERVFGFVRDITERKRAERTKEAFLTLGTSSMSRERQWTRPKPFMAPRTSSGMALRDTGPVFARDRRKVGPGLRHRGRAASRGSGALRTGRADTPNAADHAGWAELDSA